MALIQERTKVFWKTSIALSIGSLVIFANIYFPQPLLPLFTKEFHISPLMSSMTVSLVILSLGISLLFYGPISDSIGRRGIMITTMALATIATFLAAFAPNFESLLWIRVIQGVFLAGLPSLAVAYIGEEYAVKAIPLAIGIYISGNTIGGMFGRIVSGVAADLFNWRWAFAIMGIISVVCFLLFVILLNPSKRFKPKKFSWKKALRQYKYHILNKELQIAYFIGGLHFAIFVGHFNYVTYVLSSPPYELSSSFISMLFLTYIAGTFSSPIAGRLSVCLSQSFCIGIGIFMMIIGYLMTLNPSLWFVVSGLFFNCFGFFFAHSIASSWVSSRARYTKASASGLYLIFYYLGGSLGPFYLYPFWSLIEWEGIVIGCLLVLGGTSFFAWKMYQVESLSKLLLHSSRDHHV